MKRRGFLRATAGAGVLSLSGCLGGGGDDGNDDQNEVSDGPYGTFRVIRDSEARAIRITVEEPQTADHVALGGEQFDKSPIMTDIQQGDSMTLSVGRGHIEPSGTVEVVAIRGEVETTERNGITVLDSEPEEARSIEDDDNPFSYDFSEEGGGR